MQEQEKITEWRDIVLHECNYYPCEKLRHLDERYRNKYGMSMVENLNTIKKYGLKTFIKIKSTNTNAEMRGIKIDP